MRNNQNKSKIHKTQISIYIDNKLLEWIDKMVNLKRFHNRSHAIEECVFLSKYVIEKKHEEALEELGNIKVI